MATSSTNVASTVVAVDKDKNSQHALRWAVENLRLKEKMIVLVHVATNQPKLEDGDGFSCAHSEMQQLFLPFRVFCGRKGIRTKEVILCNLDIAAALSDFLNAHSIKNIVLGASSRGAIARAFRNGDVATFVGKLAPDFCSVYSVSKAKANRIKSSSDAITPAPKLPPHVSPVINRDGSPGKCNREYQPSSPSERSIASTAPSPAYSMTSHDSRHLYQWEKRRDPTPSESTNNISYESSRMSLDSMAENRNVTPPIRPPGVKALERLPAGSFSHHHSFWSSNHSDQHSYPSDISYELVDEPRISDASTTSNLATELEDELKRVKLELKLITEKYNASCLGTETKEKDIAEFRITEEAALAIAERKKQNSKAAMEILEKARKVADMESEKRREAERKFEYVSEEKHKIVDALEYSLARCRRYSGDEIEAATKNFSSHKIGEGSYGPVYRATIDHTPVAIKILKSDIPDGLNQFHQEVEVLSRMRHPNMVILMGACPEYGCLVYEYMENGSLEDRLFCKDGSPPLPWVTRFSIAVEITTGLNFLHQRRPQPLVHRDLKPGNILLDRNYVSKISDVGLSRLIPAAEADNMTQYRMTAAAGTFCYIDPEYQQTGLLGTKSDVYSLGIILLQIITARPPMGLTHLVETAIQNGRFAEILDPRVQDWPVHEALELAKLALQCSELRRRDRPDLVSVVLPELVRLRNVASKLKPERRTYYFTYAHQESTHPSHQGITKLKSSRRINTTDG